MIATVLRHSRTMTSLSLCVPLMIVVLMLGGSSSHKICCTRYDPVRVPIKEIKYYVEQDLTEFCDLRAVIFQTKVNKPVCANPNAEWVKRAMTVVPRFDQWKKQVLMRGN